MPKCPICETAEVYYDSKIDTYFCDECDIWIEAVCKDPEHVFYENKSQTLNQRTQVNE